MRHLRNRSANFLKNDRYFEKDSYIDHLEEEKSGLARRVGIKKKRLIPGESDSASPVISKAQDFSEAPSERSLSTS
jgi:hypothetical protein